MQGWGAPDPYVYGGYLKGLFCWTMREKQGVLLGEGTPGDAQSLLLAQGSLMVRPGGAYDMPEIESWSAVYKTKCPPCYTIVLATKEVGILMRNKKLGICELTMTKVSRTNLIIPTLVGGHLECSRQTQRLGNVETCWQCEVGQLTFLQEHPGPCCIPKGDHAETSTSLSLNPPDA